MVRTGRNICFFKNNLTVRRNCITNCITICVKTIPFIKDRISIWICRRTNCKMSRNNIGFCWSFRIIECIRNASITSSKCFYIKPYCNNIFTTGYSGCRTCTSPGNIVFYCRKSERYFISNIYFICSKINNVSC